MNFFHRVLLIFVISLREKNQNLSFTNKEEPIVTYLRWMLRPFKISRGMKYAWSIEGNILTIIAHKKKIWKKIFESGTQRVMCSLIAHIKRFVYNLIIMVWSNNAQIKRQIENL